jgi:hypothetical protein
MVDPAWIVLMMLLVVSKDHQPGGGLFGNDDFLPIL